MYVELITRIATQELDEDCGDEKAALNSIHALFPITREILKSKGRLAPNFTKIAVVVLNQILRPFCQSGIVGVWLVILKIHRSA